MSSHLVPQVQKPPKLLNWLTPHKSNNNKNNNNNGFWWIYLVYWQCHKFNMKWGFTPGPTPHARWWIPQQDVLDTVLTFFSTDPSSPSCPYHPLDSVHTLAAAPAPKSDPHFDPWSRQWNEVLLHVNGTWARNGGAFGTSTWGLRAPSACELLKLDNVDSVTCTSGYQVRS